MAKIPATEAELKQEQRKVYRNAAAGGRAFGFVVTGIPSLIALVISLAITISRVWRYSIAS